MATEDKNTLLEPVMDTMCSLICWLGRDFCIFLPIILKVTRKHNIEHAGFDELVGKLQKQQPIPPFQEWRASHGEDRERQLLDGRHQLADANTDKSKEVFSENNLRKAWDARNKSTKDDWINWIRKLSVALLRESPSPALRSCKNLAQVYYPLARELFPASFYSCWTEVRIRLLPSLLYRCLFILTPKRSMDRWMVGADVGTWPRGPCQESRDGLDVAQHSSRDPPDALELGRVHGAR